MSMCVYVCMCLCLGAGRTGRKDMRTKRKMGFCTKTNPGQEKATTLKKMS